MLYQQEQEALAGPCGCTVAWSEAEFFFFGIWVNEEGQGDWRKEIKISSQKSNMMEGS